MDAVTVHALPEVPLELVDDILEWAMELDTRNGTAISLATVCKYTHSQAIKYLYSRIVVKNFDTLHLLNMSLKMKPSLAKLTKTLIIDLIDDGTYKGAWVRRQLTDLFANMTAAESTLQNLHVLCNSDRFFEYPYGRLDLKSLLCRNHSMPHATVSQPHLTHLIHDDPDYLVRFEPTRYPALTHIATAVILPWTDIWSAYTRPAFLNLVEQQGARLKSLVVVLAREIAALADKDLRTIVKDTPIQLITLTVPNCLGPIKKWTARDFFNLKAAMSQAHLDGSLWDAEHCTPDLVFRDTVPDGRPADV
ncbi:hypothetical protein NEOLEDRAFT_1129567 [Neolentinus lepideus HHB14362 ss-1]|uniref:F-box domain-containing protein n=1 Tax=Neolentinus lepideus HHB14362 ss-1 TaxID=1314782 RepID=A0A165UIQ0_9AGAM|nr:hypothetical protein NEOLEDRAFT_1129567 [Neolentinus lepideus HHB14362 ss-1]